MGGIGTRGEKQDTKVALLSPVYPYPRAGFFPGIERYAEMLAQALVKVGVEVKVITSYWNGGKEREVIDGAEILRAFDVSDRLSTVGRLFDMQYYTLGRDMLLRYRDEIAWADVVHTLMPLSSAKSVHTMKPLVSHFHHPVDFSSPVDLLHLPFHHRIERGTFRESDLVIAHSGDARRRVARLFHLEMSKVVSVYPGVSVSLPHHARRSGKTRTKLLYVGTLEKRKGVDYLVDAMKQVVDQIDTVDLTIVGDGPEKAKLQRQVRSLRLEKSVRILPIPYLTEEERGSFYSESDIFVFPSRLEGFGMVVAEAMACGLPVIATRIGGIVEALGGTGILINPKDPRDLATAILRLTRDTDLRGRLGESGRQRCAQEFSWSRAANETLSAYEMAIDAWKKR